MLKRVTMEEVVLALSLAQDEYVWRASKFAAFTLTLWLAVPTLLIYFGVEFPKFYVFTACILAAVIQSLGYAGLLFKLFKDTVNSTLDIYVYSNDLELYEEYSSARKRFVESLEEIAGD